MLSGKGWKLIGNYQMRGVSPAFFFGLLHGLYAGNSEVIGVVTLFIDNPADHRHRQRRVASRTYGLPMAALVSQHRSQWQGGRHHHITEVVA